MSCQSQSLSSFKGLIIALCVYLPLLLLGQTASEAPQMQRVPDEFFLTSPTWINGWKSTQLEKLTKEPDRVVMLLIIRHAQSTETIVVVRKEKMGSSEFHPKNDPRDFDLQLEIATTSDATNKVLRYPVASDVLLGIAVQAWNMVTEAGAGSEGKKLTLDANEVWYLFCREPLANKSFSNAPAQMAQAVNPGKTSSIGLLRQSLLNMQNGK